MQYIIANSWVSSEHGWRVFFTGKAYLPKDTPVALTDERQRELERQRRLEALATVSVRDLEAGMVVEANVEYVLSLFCSLRSCLHTFAQL